MYLFTIVYLESLFAFNQELDELFDVLDMNFCWRDMTRTDEWEREKAICVFNL